MFSFKLLLNLFLLLPSNLAITDSTLGTPNVENMFKFLPENGRNKYNLGEVKCKENAGNETIGGGMEQIGNCIGQIVLSVDAVQIPLEMKTYEYILPRPSESIVAYEIHFGVFKGKFMGQLNWGGKWPKIGEKKRFWIVLSRFGRFLEGKFIEPRHLLGKGPVNAENGKFELEIEGKKPTAIYIWIYELIGCGEGEEEECAENRGQKEEDGGNEKISKLFHAIILENPSISDDEFQFEYEIDLNGADNSKMEEFAGRYTKIFRQEIEERWDDWWEFESRQFRWAETVALRLQQIDFIFADENAGNGTIAVSGKPAIEM